MTDPRARTPRLTLVSGGQTGVDRAALEVAHELGLPRRGWCPAGGWAEDLPRPPGLLARYPELRPTPDRDPVQRTLWNVRDSDATLVVVPDDGWVSPGTRRTVEEAEHAVRPCLVHPVSARPAEVTAWLTRLLVGRAGLVLNVAGPRESEAPGITVSAARLLRAALPL